MADHSSTANPSRKGTVFGNSCADEVRRSLGQRWRSISSAILVLRSAQRPGQKLATYQISTSGSLVHFTLTSTNVYFASKLVSRGTYNSSGGPSGSVCGSILQEMPIALRENADGTGCDQRS